MHVDEPRNDRLSDASITRTSSTEAIPAGLNRFDSVTVDQDVHAFARRGPGAIDETSVSITILPPANGTR